MKREKLLMKIYKEVIYQNDNKNLLRDIPEV